ncbi:helix-turn-helix transcriptional regulator [Paracoccus cavernae]|uniref:helix-turn-helix transcriptional regulator n=1 Tax=Paracoccus cavernae TaxID=1571207 RepID=UPI0035F4F4C8
MLNDVERLMYAPSVEDVWAYLTSETKKLGLPYVHYTIYRVLEADGLDMPKEVMLLSNLDKSLLDRFENEDFLIAAPLSRWLHNNGGTISWAWVFDQWQQGLLSQPEVRALQAFLEKGHFAGWGMSLRGIAPRLAGGIVFGGPLGMTQPELDRIWNKHARRLIALSGLAHMRLASLPSEKLSEQLTPRQREVLESISAGKSNAEVAARLNISLPTVEKHLRLARQALGVRTTAQAIVLATVRNQIFVTPIRRIHRLAEAA